jgi:Winged helix DNA-binding domain
VPAAVLSDRALNRALLARQGLLQRTPRPALEMVEHLVGLQAQEPANPYLALWSRLERFDPQELSALVAERRAVRAQLMRATIHLVSARDYLALQPLTRGVLAQVFKNGFLRRLGGAPVGDVIAAGVELLAERPRTRGELGAALAAHWPDADPPALAQAITFHAPLVQVPPRGLWGEKGQARWALAEDWLTAPVDAAPAAEAVVRRYLAAFGPASVADVRTWSGITGLRAVVERLRPQLRTFADDRGRELLDVEDGPIPHPETPAPPRFLPEYDNVLLSHADRSRILGAGGAPPDFAPRGGGWLLVDGFHRAHWHLVAGRDVATLTIDRYEPAARDPPGTVEAITSEAGALLSLLAAEAAAHRVQFIPSPRPRR